MACSGGTSQWCPAPQKRREVLEVPAIDWAGWLRPPSRHRRGTILPAVRHGHMAARRLRRGTRAGDAARSNVKTSRQFFARPETDRGAVAAS